MTIAEKLREEGRQEGERGAALKIARAMLASGLDRESVMKMTGLTADDLAHIRHQAFHCRFVSRDESVKNRRYLRPDKI